MIPTAICGRLHGTRSGVSRIDRTLIQPAIRPSIRPLADLDRAALLALNNAHATELSLLSAGRLAQMLSQSFYARGVGDVDGALIAFDQDSPYDGLNFAWFRARYERFVYIDRVVIAPAARGKGLARALYADLFAVAASAGHSLATCEVNIDPPNPASLAFHAEAGFLPVGEASWPEKGRTVRFLACALP